SVCVKALKPPQPHVQAAGHRISLALPPRTVYLDGDPMRLAQVLSNLINNACKYSENNGDIRIDAEVESPRDPAHPKSAKQLIISVSDTGIGIAAEHLARIFELFSQIGSVWDRSQG